MRTPEETALLIVLLFKRSGQRRARISVVTLRRLSKRRHIRSAFLGKVEESLDDLGLILVELERGGYGLLPLSALDGAPAITAKRYLQDEQGVAIDFEAIRKEIGQEWSLDADEE